MTGEGFSKCSKIKPAIGCLGGSCKNQQAGTQILQQLVGFFQYDRLGLTIVLDEKYCLSCEIYRNSFLCFVTLEQWFQQGDNPSDISFLSLFNNLQSRSNGIGIRY